MVAKKSAKITAKKQESVGLMEPMLPPEGNRELEDLAFELVTKASSLAPQLNPALRERIGDLVRSMNCYYSNLIEGHNTHPRDIAQALTNHFSANPEKRALQLEAKAHIAVQLLVDRGEERVPLHRIDYIKWVHREFSSNLPEELLWVKNPDTKRRIKIKPGELRDGGVQIGLHVPARAESLPAFLGRYTEAYSPNNLSKIRQVIGVAAAHHRLLWIHPFYDGNGRVARLLSHAYLREIGVGSSLWSVSRGLARNVVAYKGLLMAADGPRKGDWDGRGFLSTEALNEFCAFFLRTCIDQIEYMGSLLEPKELLNRIELYVVEEVNAGRLPTGSFNLLREAVFSGEFDRGKAPEITGYKERQGRRVLAQVLERGLLTSDSPKGPVRLHFPAEVVERWFPKLYPAT